MRIKLRLIVLLICIGQFAWAQVEDSTGIQFVNQLSWQQIIKKASRENKIIFV